MNVFLDGSYVSKTDILDISTGDSFQCTLGIDTSAKVVHTLISSSTTSTASSFVEQYKTTTYTSTTTITNRHTGDYPIQIVERSSLPVASPQDTRIKVFLKEPEGLAEGDEGTDIDLGRPDQFKVKWGTGLDESEIKDGKKSGKFIWHGTINPGKEVVLVSKWDIRAPVDVEWVERSWVSDRKLQSKRWTLTSRIQFLSSEPIVPTPVLVEMKTVLYESELIRSWALGDPCLKSCESNFSFSPYSHFGCIWGYNTLGRAACVCTFLLNVSR